jgi:N-acetylglucosamine-6-phosphate deacetylase
MSPPLVVRGRLQPHGDPVDVIIESGRIRETRPANPRPDASVLGDEGWLLSAGFLDLQVNGFAGVDFNRPDLTVEELRRAIAAMWRTGVTAFFPTVITAPIREMLGALKAIARAREADAVVRRATPAIHLEGPFLAPEDGPRGAHPAAHVLDPDWDVFQRLQEAAGGLIRLVTLAPERPGAIGLIAQLRQARIVVGIGHTAATETEIDEAVQAGAQLSTHLGNGAHAMLPRHRNYIQKQLATDALMASIIVDGHHLPEFMVKNIVRCKGADRIVLVTDAMAAAAAPPGRYRLGEVVADAGPDGCVRLPGTPYLAGSALTMDCAIANTMRYTGLALGDAVRLAGCQPRQLVGEAGEEVAPGQPADLVLLREGPPLAVEATVVQGEVVYRRT